MALQHGAHAAKLYGNGINLGAFAKSFQAEGKRDTDDATPLDPDVHGGGRMHTSGADSGTYSLETMLDDAAPSVVWSMLQRVFGREDVIIAAPLGDEYERPAALLVAGTTEAAVPVLTDKTVGVSLKGQTQNGFGAGIVALPWAVYDDTSEGDAIDNGVDDTNVIVEWGVVVGEFDGTDATFILQESALGSIWVDVDELTVTTGNEGAHGLVEVGTLEQHRRIIVDPASTFTDVEAVAALVVKKR